MTNYDRAARALAAVAQQHRIREQLDAAAKASQAEEQEAAAEEEQEAAAGQEQEPKTSSEEEAFDAEALVRRLRKRDLARQEPAR